MRANLERTHISKGWSTKLTLETKMMKVLYGNIAHLSTVVKKWNLL